ncbi:porin family protein [Hyphococcus lacteus]|uniref:Porin family protein n=1 Tax=Hyphococcus lacteus TaxID=3143536 RepID=A0ABV3ZBM6_9PROT
MKTFKRTGKSLARAAGIFVASTAVFASAQAQESGFYANIGASFATSNADQIELVETGAGLITIRAGYNLNRYLSVEAEGNITALTPDIDPTGVNGREGALNYSRGFAGYLVARYPVTESIELFARGGYHHTRIILRAEDLMQSATFDNVAYGGGASYNWGRNGIRVDYTILNVSRINQSTDNIDQRIIGLSFVRWF